MKLIFGDAVENLRGLEIDSIDALITDPPAGIAFMGKDWDSGKDFVSNMTEIYKECLRALKPGAHGLVWAILIAKMNAPKAVRLKSWMGRVGLVRVLGANPNIPTTGKDFREFRILGIWAD